MVVQVKVCILMGRPKLPSYMLALWFFPAWIVSVSPRGTFEKHEKWIQVDDLVCSLDVCYVRQSVFEQTSLVTCKRLFQKLSGKVGRLEFFLVFQNYKNYSSQQCCPSRKFMWKELLLAKVFPVNKCVSVICRILRMTPPITLYNILPFWV